MTKLFDRSLSALVSEFLQFIATQSSKEKRIPSVRGRPYQRQRETQPNAVKEVHANWLQKRQFQHKK